MGVCEREGEIRTIPRGYCVSTVHGTMMMSEIGIEMQFIVAEPRGWLISGT